MEFVSFENFTDLVVVTFCFDLKLIGIVSLWRLKIIQNLRMEFLKSERNHLNWWFIAAIKLILAYVMYNFPEHIKRKLNI